MEAIIPTHTTTLLGVAAVETSKSEEIIEQLKIKTQPEIILTSEQRDR